MHRALYRSRAARTPRPAPAALPRMRCAPCNSTPPHVPRCLYRTCTAARRCAPSRPAPRWQRPLLPAARCHCRRQALRSRTLRAGLGPPTPPLPRPPRPPPAPAVANHPAAAAAARRPCRPTVHAAAAAAAAPAGP
eukprot:351123-Chlamydomonas_euryale.AAC.6